VTQLVHGQALVPVNDILGTTGAGAGNTFLNDGVLDQVLAVNDIVRRGRTQGSTEGQYLGLLRNNHTDAEAVSSTVNPYTVSVGRVPPYPSLPANSMEKFDIYLLDAIMRRESGSGTIEATLFINDLDVFMGWGVDDAGLAVTQIRSRILAAWDTITVFSSDAVGLQGNEMPVARIGQRLTRGSSLIFLTESSATSVYDCIMTLGIFPVGLGQDVAVS